LFVPIVGIISPASVGVVPSIAFLIGVAIGGRSTLFGPALGAIVVAWAQTTLSESFPSFWTYFQGALLVLVVAFLPGGLSSVGLLLRRRRTEARADDPPLPVRPTAADRPAPEPDLSGISAESGR
jgi:urea transport system permease protein